MLFTLCEHRAAALVDLCGVQRVGPQQEFTERLNPAVLAELVSSEEELPRSKDDPSVSHWLEI